MSEIIINFDDYSTICIPKVFLEKYCTPNGVIKLPSMKYLNVILGFIAGVNFNMESGFKYELTDDQYLKNFKCDLPGDKIIKLIPEISVFIDDNFKPIKTSSVLKQYKFKNLENKYQRPLAFDITDIRAFEENVNSMLEGWDFEISEIPAGVYMVGEAVVNAILRITPEYNHPIVLMTCCINSRNLFKEASDFLSGLDGVIYSIEKDAITFVKPGAAHNIVLQYTSLESPYKLHKKTALPGFDCHYVKIVSTNNPVLYISCATKMMLESGKAEFSAVDITGVVNIINTLSRGIMITNMPQFRHMIPTNCTSMQNISSFGGSYDRFIQIFEDIEKQLKNTEEWKAHKNAYIDLTPNQTEDRRLYIVSLHKPNTIVGHGTIDKNLKLSQFKY